MSRVEVEAFFVAYRDAFDRLDGDAVADLWHTPSGIADHAPGGTHGAVEFWAADAPMRSNLHALCAAYAAADYGRASFEIEHHVPLGPHHAFANLRWTLSRRDGSLLQAFFTGYHLLRTVDGPKVLMATAYEEDLAEMKPHAAQ